VQIRNEEFGPVVRIVQLSMISPSGLVHSSHNPALKSDAEKLAAKLQQAKLDKASEYVSFSISEIETAIQIAKSNRR
jgi:hypothetical protein